MEVMHKIDSYRKYMVTILLIAVNIIVFGVLSFQGDTEQAAFMAEHGAMYPDLIVKEGEWWRLFTAVFLHFGFRHLINNMFLLGCVGSRLEAGIGHIRYLLVYLAAGLGGNLLSLWQMISSGDYAVSAGASGAIFGLMGGLLLLVIRHHGHYEALTAKGLLFMALFCLYCGYSTEGVNNWAHLGGLASGVLCSLLLLIF